MGLRLLRPVGRLAPTPSGDLHLGNVCAVAAAWLSSRARAGRVLLRMEDVDTTRSRREVEERQRADLRWLGLHWDEETRRQSERDYGPALEALADHTYRCTCTRRQIRDAGGVYPGTCRTLGRTEGAVRFRLEPGPELVDDRRWGPTDVVPDAFGDPVLVRKDGLAAYNLAVVTDDVLDGVSEVVRGADLLEFTGVQVRLWKALGATPPTWLHAPLILGPDGRKLSKSHGALHVGALREAGWTPADVWRLVLPWLGLEGDELQGAVERFDPMAGPRGPLQLTWEGEDAPAPGRIGWRPSEESS